MTAKTTVFQGIGATLDNATATFVTDVVSDTIATIYPWAIGGLTLFLVLYGYMLMMGRIQDAGSSGFIMTGKVLIISLLALNADIYLNWVVSGLQGVEDGLTSAFGGGGGSTVYETLDSSLSKGLELILQAREKASEASWRQMGTIFGWWLIAALIAVGFGLVVVFGGIAILLSTVYLKILFAIGPLFILMLMWPVTARFFDQWFGFVINHTIIVALTAVVLTLGVSIYDHQISKVAMDSDQNMLAVALELLIVAAILYALVKGVMPMAAALAGGLTMGVMTARSLSGGVKQTADIAKGAGKGSLAAGKGMYGAGQWAANKLRRGNKVENGGSTGSGSGSGGGGWQPAYRDAVLANLRRAQGKR